MAEYIEREAAKRALADSDVVPKYKADNRPVTDKIIDDIPAADVAPVVYARWNSMDGYKTRKVCSECGWDVPEYGKFYSYCPNCGAKMDGGAENG